jgi:hypothetical protein
MPSVQNRQRCSQGLPKRVAHFFHNHSWVFRTIETPHTLLNQQEQDKINATQLKLPHLLCYSVSYFLVSEKLPWLPAVIDKSQYVWSSP